MKQMAVVAGKATSVADRMDVPVECRASSLSYDAQ